MKTTPQESRAILNAGLKPGCSQLPPQWSDRQGKSHVPGAHTQCPAHCSSGHQEPAHISEGARLLTGRSKLVKSWKPWTSTPAGPTHAAASALEQAGFLCTSLQRFTCISGRACLFQPIHVLGGSLHDDNQTPVVSGNNKQSSTVSSKF